MLVTRMFKPLSAFALVLFLFAGEVPEAQAQGAPECGCQALRNLKNRLCTVRAAQREFQRLSAKFSDDEKAGGKPILFDDEIEAKIDACVQDAVDQVTDIEAQNAKGKTLSGCAIKVESTNPRHPQSKCIDAIVRRHEEHHRDACRKRNEDAWLKVWWEGASFKSGFSDSKYAMSAVDYMAEERAAYWNEEVELTQTLRRLLKTCKETEKFVTVEATGVVPGKKDGEKYSFDPSVNPCPPPLPKEYGKCLY